MEYSQCCQAELKKEFIIEQFHGCDDGYDLKVPAYRCSNCKKLYSLAFHKMYTGSASNKDQYDYR